MIDQVERAAPRHFIVTGGDPMCREDIYDLIDYAHFRKIPVSLSPSATPRLLRADFGRLRRLGIERMSLSLDGPDRESHDRFRGLRGPWDWTMKALERCREAGISVQINTTVTGENIGRFDAFAELMEGIRPDVWSLFILVPVGRGKEGELPSPIQMEAFFNRLYDHACTAPYLIKTTEGMHYRRVVAQRRRSEGVARSGDAPVFGTRGINDGKGVLFISHIGEICPSGFLPVAAGNVKSHELIDVYRGSPLFRTLRDPLKLKGKCGHCHYNRLCGGSRARAFAMTRDYMESEPLCIHQPEMNV